MEMSCPNIPTLTHFMSFRPSLVGSWKVKVIEDAFLLEFSSFLGLNSHYGAAKGRQPTKMGF